jgi:hypothetical protein
VRLSKSECHSEKQPDEKSALNLRNLAIAPRKTDPSHWPQDDREAIRENVHLEIVFGAHLRAILLRE